MTPADVVALQPAESFQAGLRSLDQPFLPFSASLLKVTLKLSAEALSAELPTALMDWIRPARPQASAKALLVYCPYSTGRRNTGCLDR